MTLTREGKRFMLATALIAVAAVNTGNNLIYLILSLMLSVVLLSYLILKTNLSGLLLEVSFTGPVFANEPAVARLLVRNRKRLQAYSLNLHAADAVEKVYCSHIPGRGSAGKEMTMVFKRRGLHGQRDFLVRSGFPFILFQQQITAGVPGTVLVYPTLKDIHGLIGEIEARENLGESAARGKGDDVYSLREYQYGDDWRRVHWKASARLSALIVKEYAEYLSEKVTILIENRIPREGANFEKAVSAAASLAYEYLGRGYMVRLVSCRKVVPFGSGEEHLYALLDVLALLAEEEQCDHAGMPDSDGLCIRICKSARSRMQVASDADEVTVYADSL